MTLREEIAQGENVTLEFKAARPKDSLKYLTTVGALANGCSWRTVFDILASHRMHPTATDLMIGGRSI